MIFFFPSSRKAEISLFLVLTALKASISDLFSLVPTPFKLKDILENLGISQKELREICILSGSDYNINIDNCKNAPNLYGTLKYFKKYFREKQTDDFYDWLIKKTNYITDYDLLKKIYDMFDINLNPKLRIFEKIKIMNGPIMRMEINEILKTDGFIFPIIL